MSDLISREEAITAIESHIRTAEEPYQLSKADEIMNYAFEVSASCVHNLPSEQKGCDGCAFDAVSTKNYPCSACIRSFRDLWTKEEE